MNAGTGSPGRPDLPPISHSPRPSRPPRRLRDLPTPPGVPFFGQGLAVEPERFHQQLEAWREQIGDPFRVKLGARQFMVTGQPEAIAAVLRDRPETFGRTARIVAVSRELGFPGLFSVNGEAWRRQRPMVMAALDPGHIRSYFPSLVRVTERFARRWAGGAARGEPIDLQPDLMRYTVDVIAGLAFGADINTIDSDSDRIQQHLDQILPALFRRILAPIPLWRWWPSAADRQVAGHVAEVAKAVEGFIHEARARLDADPALRERPRNLIEAMLAARDRPASGLTDADVAGNVMTMLLAGEDTTANTLAWGIWLLARHPQALAQAAAEARAVLGEARVPQSLEQVARLEFVEACMHETMRLKPVAPVIVQQAWRDTEVAGVALPAGSFVTLLMRGGALDERHFAEPSRFDPGRWLARGDGGEAADPGSAKRVAMPFGAGPRICPGRYLALHEMKMVIAMLLAGFEIESLDVPGGGEPRERLALTMSPVGLALRLRLRLRAG